MSLRADAPSDFSIEALGETALVLRFGTTIDAATSARVHDAAATLIAARLPGIVDIVPAYATLALHYEPSMWIEGNGVAPWRQVVAAVRAVFAQPPPHDATRETTVEIPVCYGGAHGADLAEVARHAALAIDEVVRRHCAAEYRVAMLGFAPGFPYLLGLDDALRMPRRATPRTRVPAGSVAIGGAQTGIYPRELPGGWQLIGRTPARLFDARRDAPCLIGPGDRVRFVPIDAAAFDAASRAGDA